MIKFSPANTKLKKLYKVEALKPYLANNRKIYSFDLLAGWACPFANECKSQAIVYDSNEKQVKLTEPGFIYDRKKHHRKLKDGDNMKYRCFSASQEVIFTTAFNLRLRNFQAIKELQTSEEIYRVLQAALPANAGVVRLHVSGDFFKKDYMAAVIKLAKKNTHVLFYAYTKALPFWIEFRNTIDKTPNLVFTASVGGTHDHLINAYDLRSCTVVEDEEQAKGAGLELDDDDSHAADPSKKFARFGIVIHGMQKKGRLPIVL